MSENKHTPGPWVIGRPPSNGEQTIGDKNGLMVAVATTGYGVNSEANARRIVACVNACAGMTNEQLDNICMISGSILSRFGEQMHYLGQVEKQRDELMAALENCRLLAARHRKEEWAGHVLRFCGEAGVAGEVMR